MKTTLRVRVSELFEQGATMEDAISICKAEVPALKPYRVREIWHSLASGNISRDRRSIENDYKPRKIEQIWNALRQREQCHHDALRAKVTLPRVAWLEREEID